MTDEQKIKQGRMHVLANKKLVRKMKVIATLCNTTLQEEIDQAFINHIDKNKDKAMEKHVEEFNQSNN